MPPRVYEAHLKKSHTPEEVQSQIKKNEEEIKEIKMTEEPRVGGATCTIHGGISEDPKWKCPQCEIVKANSFDWGEVYPCNSCGVEYPAKAMPWHSKQAHGV